MDADDVRRARTAFGDAINSTPSSAARSRVKLLPQATTGIPNARPRGIIS
jgi:hypothetical protein